MSGYRSALLERLQRSSANVYYFVAPAGYGKSTLAKEFGTRFQRRSQCDCCEVASVRRFAQLVVAALADEQPERREYFTALEFQLGAASDDAAIRALLDPAWSINAGRAIFVFENAEAIAGNSAIVNLFMHLLGNAPQDRKIIVCSRTPLNADSGFAIPPHLALTVDAKQLALRQDEAEILSRDAGARPGDIPLIVKTSAGWPILLLLLARLSSEGTLHDAIARMEPFALDHVKQYLITEVLRPASTELHAFLTACAAIGNPSAGELEAVLGLSENEIREYAQQAPLLTEESGRFELHGFLQQTITSARRSDDLDYIRTTAGAYNERRGMYIRAAQLYRIAGNYADAARALCALPLEQYRDVHDAFEIAQVDYELVRAFPKLALLIAVQHAMLDERYMGLVFDLSKTLNPETDAETRVSVIATAVGGALVLGLYECAAETVHSESFSLALETATPAVRGMLRAFKEATIAFTGPFGDAIERLTRVFAGMPDVALDGKALLAWKLAAMHRYAGNRASSIRWADEGIAWAQHSGCRFFSAINSVEAVVNAWFWGDERRVETLLAGVHGLIENDPRMADTRLIEEAFEGRLGPQLRWARSLQTYAALIAASRNDDDEARMHLIERAAAVPSAGTHDAPLRFLVHVARAAAQPERRAEHLRLAVDTAKTAGFDHLAEQGQLLADGRCAPTLDAFYAHFSKHAIRGSGVRLNILTQTVQLHGSTVRTTPREFALLSFLAGKNGTVSTAELQDALWPDLDEQSARSALYSLLYRLRKRFGSQSIVDSLGGAYRLSSDVSVDLWTMEKLIVRLQRGDKTDTAIVERLLEAIAKRSYPHLLHYEWFMPVDYRVREAQRTLIAHVVSAASAKSDFETVLRMAKILVDEDHCDEWGHELIIRYHISNGNHNEALREYQRYREVLQEQLGTQPSQALTQFIQSVAI